MTNNTYTTLYFCFTNGRCLKEIKLQNNYLEKTYKETKVTTLAIFFFNFTSIKYDSSHSFTMNTG